MYKIYDSLHRFIQIEKYEEDLLQSRPFQRLRYIHQLGLTFLVYPGGTHKRFEHSLGVMEIATRMYDQITKEDAPSQMPKKGSFTHYYYRKIVRLAALCHDLGHLPFSHVAEKTLLGSEGHEKWTYRLINSHYLVPIWSSFQEECDAASFSCNVLEDICKVAIGRSKLKQIAPEMNVTSFTPIIKILSNVITGDFFGADRIDYLLRDAKYTGLAYGLFDYHQLIEMLRVIPRNNELELAMHENGMDSCASLLLSRHFMHKRIYQYEGVKIYNFHLSRFMGENFRKEIQGATVDDYISLTDNEVLALINRISKDPTHKSSEDARAIYFKDSTYKAVLAETIPAEKLKKMQKLHLSIEEQAIDQESEVSFPVIRKNGTVVNSREVTEIEIPSNTKTWIYISAKQEKEMQNIL